MSFRHPPLPAGDGLRILTLEPASSFHSSLRGTLVSVPFSSKPNYMALSYTWNDRDDEHAAIDLPQACLSPQYRSPIPCIYINGNSFRLGHNLALALLYLRSKKLPLPLWCDQICIDQTSIPERNAQVALMAFIYSRATATVSWLGAPGTKPPPNTTELDYLQLKWEHGHGSQLADLAEQPPSRWEVRYTDSSTGVALSTANPYWRRMWIVQEVCIPRRAMFLQGGSLYSDKALQADMERPSSQDDTLAPIKKLLETRRWKFTDAMRLEALIERFQDWECLDLRDKVYGLVGLANDVDSTAAGAASPPYTPQSETTVGRGRGTILIDYARSFYDIWSDVVSYMHFRARPLSTFGTNDYELRDERRTKVVRFAGVLQTALKGKVEDEVRSRSSTSTTGSSTGSSSPVSDSTVPSPDKLVYAKGYIAGEILHIGPTFSDFVGSYSAEQAWMASWEEHCDTPHNLEKLREREDTFVAKIMEYSPEDIQRNTAIDSADTVAWHVVSDQHALEETPDYLGESGMLWPHADGAMHQEPVRFLGTSLALGLAPPNALPGDIIVRFWDCDAAMVMRQIPDRITGPNIFTTPADHSAYGLVGRADIAEPHARDGGRDWWAEEKLSVFREELPKDPDPLDEFDMLEKWHALYLRMDFETLQKISANIAT